MKKEKKKKEQQQGNGFETHTNRLHTQKMRTISIPLETPNIQKNERESFCETLISKKKEEKNRERKLIAISLCFLPSFVSLFTLWRS